MMLVVVAAVSTLLLTGTASAYWSPPELSRVASVFAQRPVQVRCYDQSETDSPGWLGAWAYVNKPLAKARWLAMDGVLCQALVYRTDLRLQALAVLALVHESYHARRWGAAGSEAKVECQAIRHWKVGAELLGVPNIEWLWPYALAIHYEETTINDPFSSVHGAPSHPYYDPTCEVPRLHSEE